MDKQGMQSLRNSISRRFDKSVPQAMTVYGRRPVAASGFSPGELESAGLDEAKATALGLALDRDRMSALGANVEALKQFLRSRE